MASVPARTVGEENSYPLTPIFTGQGIQLLPVFIVQQDEQCAYDIVRAIPMRGIPNLCVINGLRTEIDRHSAKNSFSHFRRQTFPGLSFGKLNCRKDKAVLRFLGIKI